MSAFKRHIRIIPALLILLAIIPVSCLDETLVSTTRADAEADNDADMYLSISVPRTYTSTGAVVADKELVVKTLDVLVFRRNPASAAAPGGEYIVYAACQGKLTDQDRTFKVVMPVGDNLIVHVFVNCHDALVAQDFYNSRDREMDDILGKLTLDADPNATTAHCLPMHGYLTGINIRKGQAITTFTAPVLRSVAAVQVMTKATESTDATTGKLILTPGTVTDAAGNPNFALRELYVYHYAATGRIAADATAYEPLAAGTEDKTRNVVRATLPAGHTVADTRMQGGGYPRPYSLVSTDAEDRIGCLYLYENRPHASSGLDLDFTETTTSRLVIGGVYGTDKNTDGTPRVTYYRVDFADADNNLLSVLRNHKYTVSVEKVTASGYDTPDEAALGASTNVYIKLFDWTDELTNSDFNSENYFNSETKSIVLPRTQDFSRSITVESDVAVSEWKMSFATAANGTATVSGTAISNNRYRVEKATDGKSLTFTALKAYGALSTGESYNETFIIKANRLEVTYKITQTDTSADDWSNGGDQIENNLGNKVFDVGFDFVVAPANLNAVSDGRGGYIYTFTPTQGYFSGTSAGGDHFKWNSLVPGRAGSANYGSWDTAKDPCRKVAGGKWYTPSEAQLKQLTTLSSKWDAYSGGSKSGRYFNTGSTPNVENQDNYIFLPACGYDATSDTNSGYYWSTTPSSGNMAQMMKFGSSQNPNIYGGGRYSSLSVRCVANKSDFNK